MAQAYSVALPQRLWDDTLGEWANGWKITTYVAGTTTPLTTYSTPDTGGATNTNPIVTDSNGFFRCYVAKGVLIKFAVTNASNVPQAAYSFDNLQPMVDPTTSSSPPDSTPHGTIAMFSSSTPPTDWLVCDGTAVSRSTYATLFAVCGTTYGAGNGTTTFNLPDLRQRFPLGLATAGTGNV